MTANTTWQRFKRLFWNPPEAPVRSAFGHSISNNTCIRGVIVLSGYCGSSVNGVVYRCGRSDCKNCNPMTPERAAKINDRFFKERGYDHRPND